MRSPSGYARCLVAVFASLFASSVLAAPIPSLYNTGVDDSGVPLPGGSLDPHWQLVLSPDPAYPGPDLFVLNDNAPVLVGGGAANTLTSKWVGPRADGLHNFPRSDCTVGCTTADYHLQTTFDLSGLDSLTAEISGQWAMDDSAVMLLNGVNVASYPFVQGVNWRFFAPFHVTSGFVSGLNTLTVIVNNQFFPNSELRDNPTGLHLQLSGMAEVPEPVSLPLLLICVPAFRRSRTRRIG